MNRQSVEHFLIEQDEDISPTSSLGAMATVKLLSSPGLAAGTAAGPAVGSTHPSHSTAPAAGRGGAAGGIGRDFDSASRSGGSHGGGGGRFMSFNRCAVLPSEHPVVKHGRGFSSGVGSG